MSDTAVNCVRHLIDQYRNFLRSSYRLADPRLREQFEQHINETDVLVKGPYVTLAHDFEAGQPLKELHLRGIGHKGVLRLNWSFGEKPIYKHQERAFQKVESGSNCVVKTGTGSGKTEAFLFPVLSGVMKLKEKGIEGTKAILLYPMPLQTTNS